MTTFATHDRHLAADMILRAAVALALMHIRDGKPMSARMALARAGQRAERILGRAA